MIYILARKSLSGREPGNLADLITACESHDGFAALELEKSLNAFSDMRSFFLAYENDSLLGAVSLFAPEKDEAEICALIRPSCRGRGIFKLLLGEAEREMSLFGYSSELIVVDERSDAGKAAVGRLGAAYAFTEYSMRYAGAPPQKNALGIVARRMGADRIEELIQLLMCAEGDSREDAESFERRAFATPTRQQYGAFLGDVLVGACSLAFEASHISINALVIDTPLRGRGYGQAFLAEIIELLAGAGPKIVLDVNSLNANAFHIYKKVGFVAERSVEYHRRPLASQISMSRQRPRELLIRELEEYRITNPLEKDLVDRFAAFVASREDAFSRSCLEGHVTGSAFITDPAFERILFVHHVKLDKWLQPGGHCEPGETSREAAAREAREETGIVADAVAGLGLFDIDIHDIPEREGVPFHCHYDARYLFTASPGGEAASEESHTVEWLDYGEAIARNPEFSISRPLAKIESLRAAKA